MKKVILSLLWSVLANALFAQGKITAITIEKTPCFGMCPWYYLTIESNGNVTYTGKKDAVFDGVMPGKLSKAEVSKLFTKYQSRPYWKLPSSYKSQVADLSKTHILIKSGTKTKTVKNANEGPDWLKNLIQDIDNLQRDKKIVWDKKRFLPNKKEEEELPVMKIAAGDDPKLEVVQPSQEYQVFSIVEQMPEYPGGQQALVDFISKNLRYPEKAREAGIEGKVIVAFVVDKEGFIQSPNIVRGIGYDCEKEVLRIMSIMPRWKPGKQNGTSVNVKMHLPVTFQLK